MTRLLQEAFHEASRLNAEDQDKVARWLLSELASERRWSEAFQASSETLRKLSEEAIEEHRSGRTQDMDPDKL